MSCSLIVSLLKSGALNWMSCYVCFFLAENRWDIIHVMNSFKAVRGSPTMIFPIFGGSSSFMTFILVWRPFSLLKEDRSKRCQAPLHSLCHLLALYCLLKVMGLFSCFCSSCLEGFLFVCLFCCCCFGRGSFEYVLQALACFEF